MKFTLALVVCATMALALMPSAEADTAPRDGCNASTPTDDRAPGELTDDRIGVRCDEREKAVPDLTSDAADQGDGDIIITRPSFCLGTQSYQC